MRHASLIAVAAIACSSSIERRTTVVRVQHSVVAVEGGIQPPVVVTPLQVASDGAPTLRCPASARALAGTPVHLRAEATGTGLRYRWTVTRSPQARYYRFSERFDANDSDAIVGVGQEVPFTSVIVGDYTVHTEVRDADGRTAECDTPVTLSGHGLRVELSWSTGGTDVDLHMVRARDPRWVTPADCYYGNRRPDTAQPDEARQRWLDTDDVDGEGPENIRVDAPELDEEYRIGVHYYSAHSNTAATTAIVVIYCGDQRVARFEREISGTSSPGENQFWRVAGVRFSGDGTCAVSPLRGPEVMVHQALASAPDPG